MVIFQYYPYTFICIQHNCLANMVFDLNPSISVIMSLFVCVEVLWDSQSNGVISSAVTLPNHTFTGQA